MVTFEMLEDLYDLAMFAYLCGKDDAMEIYTAMVEKVMPDVTRSVATLYSVRRWR